MLPGAAGALPAGWDVQSTPVTHMCAAMKDKKQWHIQLARHTVLQEAWLADDAEVLCPPDQMHRLPRRYLGPNR